MQSILTGLMKRDEPLVREIAPAPGTRAKRYAQLLCPDLHPLHEAARSGSRSAHDTAGGADGATAAAGAANTALAQRIDRLELELQRLQGMITVIAQALKEAGVSVDEPAESAS